MLEEGWHGTSTSKSASGSPVDDWIASTNLTSPDEPVVCCIANSGLGDADVLGLCGVIRDKTHVTAIILRGNSIGSAGVSFLSDMLAENHSITELDLAKNAIGDIGVTFLGSSLSLHRGLTSLNLSRTTFGDPGLWKLSEGLQNNFFLTEIDLSGNLISDDGSISLVKTLKVNKSLTYLNLAGNCISNYGARELIQSLSFNYSLTALDLKGNKVSDYPDIAGIMNNNPFLVDMTDEDEKICHLLQANKQVYQEISLELEHEGIHSPVMKYIHQENLLNLDLLNIFITASAHNRRRLCVCCNNPLHPCCLFLSFDSVISVTQACLSPIAFSVLLNRGCLHIDCMMPWQARDFLHSIISIPIHSNSAGHDPLLIQEALEIILRHWAAIGNWKAAASFFLFGVLPNVNLSHLKISDLPTEFCEALVASRTTRKNFCLDISYNRLDYLPSCLYKLETVIFRGNPLSTIPQRFVNDQDTNSWEVLSSFLRYNGSCTRWTLKKLLLVGEEASGKTTLLRCLKAHGYPRHSFTGSVATDGISIHPSFKMKMGGNDFVAWDLGGQEVLYPSHQFFLGSDSVFFVLFNLHHVAEWLSNSNLTSSEPLPSTPANTSLPSTHKVNPICPDIKRLIYWAKQLRASHTKREIETRNIQDTYTIVIGSHVDKIAEKQLAIAALILASKEFSEPLTGSSLKLSSAYGLSGKTGSGFQCRYGGTSPNIGKWHKRRAIKCLIDELEDVCLKSNVHVSEKWITLYRQLTQPDRKSTFELNGIPITSWTRFAECATQCGIGLGSSPEVRSGSQVDMLEIRMCADFLYDSGAIIYFRSSFGVDPDRSSILCSSSSVALLPKNLEDLVILKPEWLSTVMKSVVSISGNERWVNNGCLSPINIPKIFSEFPSALQETLLELFQRFEIAHRRSDSSYLIPCLMTKKLPESVFLFSHQPVSSSRSSYLFASSPLQSSSPLQRSLVVREFSTASKEPLEWIKMLPGWCPLRALSCPCIHGYNSPQVFLLTGRVFQLDFIPLGLFARFVTRVLGFANTEILLIWSTGAILNFRARHQPSDMVVTLLITCSERTDTICVQLCLHTCNGSVSHLHATQLFALYAGKFYAKVLHSMTSLLRLHYQHLYDKLIQHFPCPFLLSDLHASLCNLCVHHRQTFEPTLENAENTERGVFTLTECIHAVKNDRGILQCTKSTGCGLGHGHISVTVVAPDLALDLFPIISPDTLKINYAIGKGGNGTVHRGELRGGIPVAIKELHNNQQTDLSEFMYEASVMQSMRPHPNLVRFFGVCPEPNMSLVMELCVPVPLPSNPKSEDAGCPWIKFLLEFGPLKKPDVSCLLELIQHAAEKASARRTFPENGVSKFELHQQELQEKRQFVSKVLPLNLMQHLFHDILQGLHHLHSGTPPLVHRDLHARNIFIVSLDPTGPGPWAKIADFGLSEYLLTGPTEGSRSEINIFPPEVLQGGKSDSKADIWCFGMIAGLFLDPFSSPFDHLLSDPLYSKAVKGNYVLNTAKVREALIDGLVSPRFCTPTPGSDIIPPSTSGWGLSLIEECLHRNPEDRPSASTLLTRYFA
ncbi:Protein NLRC3 [Pelomyxa schiedti]|nr:Protein NLRC3 [Pelomyxa schiedti]